MSQQPLVQVTAWDSWMGVANRNQRVAITAVVKVQGMPPYLLQDLQKRLELSMYPPWP